MCAASWTLGGVSRKWPTKPDQERPLTGNAVYRPEPLVGGGQASLNATFRWYAGEGFRQHSERFAGPNVIVFAAVACIFAARLNDQEPAIRAKTLAGIPDRGGRVIALVRANVERAQRKIAVQRPRSAVPHEQVTAPTTATTRANDKLTGEVRLVRPKTSI